MTPADAANDCLYCLFNLHLWSKETAAPMICRTRHAPPVPNDWQHCCVASDGTLTAVALLLLMALRAAVKKRGRSERGTQYIMTGNGIFHLINSSRKSILHQ
jgi:hypothetical protein